VGVERNGEEEEWKEGKRERESIGVESVAVYFSS